MRKATITFDVIHVVKKAGAFETEPLTPHQQQHHHVLPSATTTGWKSPVPYLFGGLAAMLGLIAFALLILACSYWKLSGNFDENLDEEAGEGDKKGRESDTKTSAFENSILVIMAGEEKPTFLATPATSRTTSFGDSEAKLSCSCSSSSSSGNSSDSGGGGGGGDDDERKEDVKLTTIGG